jgi:two-component system sensor histidine kinase FlrB
VLRISDNGPGISCEIKERIFEPFITSKPSGTGLGLYIVKRNVEQLGGTINCESKPERGTCFTVRLPFGSEKASATTVS